MGDKGVKIHPVLFQIRLLYADGFVKANLFHFSPELNPPFMSETCNSRHFSWLMKSCFPNPNDSKSLSPIPLHHHASLCSLPDDLLLECLSRVPSSSLPSVSLVCRRWSRLLSSRAFPTLRRLNGLLHHSVFALSAFNNGLFAAAFWFQNQVVHEWKIALHFPLRALPLENLSSARLCAIGPTIYVIGRNETLRYDTWSGTVGAKSPIVFPRKKFAAAVVNRKIYVAGGGSREATAVEEYDPDSDTWRVVSHSPRRRYGCVGAAVDGVFYVIGGLKIGSDSANEVPRAAAGSEAHVYASSMDLYDVETRGWLRSRTLPGGGCVVAACATGGYVYVLASHAVELSFWRFNGLRKNNSGGGFGEWCRIKSPPLPTQLRIDSTVRFSCVGVEDKVVLVQVSGGIDDLFRRSGRTVRGMREGLVLVYDCSGGEWSRGADLPEVIRRAVCVSVEH
ncbi:hypothetical protein HS088_TW02G00647 [Tripterygium wilfordii]|uniref:F-box domain-containing protein n=1 Tax=Tripterygium wilfordii TaxID=458696 RepID=A0A7J7DZ07_TRIWF|nr:F-box/kelch-repeat protein At5g26960 [Tripterygium wilfordii]KAF5751632.1 hypothetical protein HS088_TW02G00647 [Tripterygium wilfordii]